MKLGKIILGIILMLGLGYKGFSQRIVRMPMRRVPPPMQMRRIQPPPVKKMELIKESYIGSRLRLTPDESRVFWPLYRQYVQDQTAVRILKRQNNSNASPDGTGQIDRELQYELELVNIRKHYKEEFLKILPPEKVSELYKSESDFNAEAIRILGERKAPTY